MMKKIHQRIRKPKKIKKKENIRYKNKKYDSSDEEENILLEENPNKKEKEKNIIKNIIPVMK